MASEQRPPFRGEDDSNRSSRIRSSFSGNDGARFRSPKIQIVGLGETQTEQEENGKEIGNERTFLEPICPFCKSKNVKKHSLQCFIAYPLIFIILLIPVCFLFLIFISTLFVRILGVV